MNLYTTGFYLFINKSKKKWSKSKIEKKERERENKYQTRNKHIVCIKNFAFSLVLKKFGGFCFVLCALEILF